MGNLHVGTPLFYRSVIRSRARLTYGQAQQILRGGEKAEPEIEDGLRLARNKRFNFVSIEPDKMAALADIDADFSLVG